MLSIFEQPIILGSQNSFVPYLYQVREGQQFSIWEIKDFLEKKFRNDGPLCPQDMDHLSLFKKNREKFPAGKKIILFLSVSKDLIQIAFVETKEGMGSVEYADFPKGSKDVFNENSCFITFQEYKA